MGQFVDISNLLFMKLPGRRSLDVLGSMYWLRSISRMDIPP